MNDNRFEMFPGQNFEKSGERELSEGESDFAEAMKTGVPEFAGEQFGVAREENNYYGESLGTSEDGEEYNEDISNAASIINYGLNAASKELGVEQVVQKINDFDPTGSSDPIGDLYSHLGVDTTVEKKEISQEASVMTSSEASFREGVNAPTTMNRSVEGAFKAIADMKELVADVEGADPRYEELRNNAKSAGMGYFEYAVKDYGVRGLTELFQVLSEQKKKAEEDEEKGDLEKGDLEEVDLGEVDLGKDNLEKGDSESKEEEHDFEEEMRRHAA